MSRARAAVGAAGAIALGLLSRRVRLGVPLWDKSLGDVLYAVLVACVVLLVRPGMRPLRVGLLTFAICFAIELFQRTGLPARTPRVVQLALGTTFAWHDVACYLAGAVTAAVVVAVARRVS